MKTNNLTDSLRTKTQAGATETHTIVSLAERLLITVEAAHELISSGVLDPVDGDESGERLKFQSDDLDAIRDAVVSATEDAVDEQVTDPKAKQFATLRALSLLQMHSRESANQFSKARATEIRLAKIAEHHDIHFGVGGEILGIVAKGASRFLRRPGASAALLARKVPGLADAAKTAAFTGGVGAVAGGTKAAMDNDPNTGILGGALKGSAIGAVAGGAGSFAGSRLNPSPALQAQLDALKAKKLAAAGRTWAGAGI